MQQINKKTEKRLKLICSVTKKIYSWILGMEKIFEKVKHITWNIIKIVVVILMIFSVPFILPSVLKLLIKIKWFDNIQEFLNYFSIFTNKYVIIYIGIGILLFIVGFGKIGEILQQITDRIRKVDVDFDRKKLSAEMEVKESIESKKISEEIQKKNNSSDLRNNIVKEIKKQQGLGQLAIDEINRKICIECDIDKLEEENDKIRSFAAYNMINKETKILLSTIYDKQYIGKEEFKKCIIEGYARRNKNNANLNTKNLNKIANNKYETIYNGLKFLNIIEPSEYDDIIKLTRNGKKFVKEYIKEKEGI